MPRAASLLVAVLAGALVVAACSSGGDETSMAPVTDGSASSSSPSDPSAEEGPSATLPDPGADRGPRALPPTFVALELDAFPRPADESCADNDDVVEVAADTSIAEALRAAEPGTTVSVSPGTYTEPNDGDSRALVVDVDDVCLRADGGEVVVEAADGQRTGIAVAADDVVVEGMTVRGFTTGVGFEQAEGQTIRGVTLERVLVEDLTGDFREGVVSFGDNREAPGTPPALDGLLLVDVTVVGSDLGISCNAGPCEHWWVERTSVTGRSGSEDSGADAFAVEEGRQIVVLDSIVSGAAADGIDTKATDVVVFGARVLDVARNGIKLWAGGDVIDTVVDGSDADAALVGHGEARYRYLHVLVTNHGDPEGGAYIGTWAYDDQVPVTLEILNSIFATNAPGGFYVPEGSTVTISRTIVDDGEAKLVDVGDELTVTVAEAGQLDELGWTIDLVVAEPGFTDPTTRDFTTTPGSPARDAADVVEGLERDLTGAPRSIGPGPDIGPYESG